MISNPFRGPDRAIRGPALVAVLALGFAASACGPAASAGSPIAAASASAPIDYPGWPTAGGIIGNPELVPILISYELHPAAGLHVGNTPLQPTLDANGRPKLAAAVIEWSLPSEPYVFVVASDGTVSAKFEGVAYHDELVAALDGLLR